MFSRCLHALGVLAFSASGGFAAQPPSPAPPAQGAEQEVTLSMDVRRVVLYVTVREEKRGSFVGDLTKESFVLQEDGKPQEIRQFLREDVPVAIGLVVDNSQSMNTKVPEVVAAAKAFVAASNPHDEMFVVHFSDDVQFGLPPSVPFSSDREQLNAALDKLRPIGMTALYDGIAAALIHLQKSKLTKKALVVISDGGDNISKRKINDIIQAAGISGSLFYAIGLYDPFDGDANPAVIRKLAEQTGGEAFFPGAVTEVSALCDNIARDLRNQYMLVYAPQERANDTAFHKVRVGVKDPKRRKLTVRTRTGYFGAAAEAGIMEKIK